jgi:hypothetical protein
VTRTAAKKIPATNARIGRWISGRETLPTVSVVVPGGNGAKRLIIDAKPGRMAARVEWRLKPVNKKILVKIGQKKSRI